MSTVTAVDLVAARFAVKIKRGEKLDIAFTIVGESALNDDVWSAKLRGRNRVLALGVSKSVVTVDTPGDSILVTVGLSAPHSLSLLPGTYLFDCMDTDTDQVWGSGTITVLRNTVIA